MIALYILLGIVLFFALLFSMKIKVYLRLTDALRVRAGFGPVMLTLVPKKERVVKAKDFTWEKHQKRLRKEAEAKRKKDGKAALKKAAKAEKAKKKAEAARLAEAAEKAAEATEEERDTNKLETILALVEFALEEIPRFVSYFETDVVMLDIAVGAKEAADTAVKYGRISALVSVLLELLNNKTRMKSRKNALIRVEPDFLAEKTVFKVEFKFRLRLFSVIRVGWHTLVWFIGRKIRESRA